MVRLSSGRMSKVAAVVVIAAVALVGCAGPQPTPSGSGEVRNLTLRLHFAPDGSMSTLYAAQALGYFEEEGLALQIEVGKGSQAAVNEVAQGKSDFATAGAVNVMIGASQGQPVESIAMWTGRSSYGFLIPEDSDVRSVSDLEGRSIVVGTGTPFAALLPSVLSSNGVDPASVEIISVDAASLVQTYASGTGDAIATAIPFAQPLVAANRPSDALPWEEVGFAIPDYSIVANADLVDEEPEVVRGFLRAMLRGIVASAADPTIGLDALKAAQPEVNLDVAEQQLAAYLPYYCGEDGVLYGTHDEEAWTGAAQLLFGAGVLKTEIDASDVFTNDLLPDDEELMCPILP